MENVRAYFVGVDNGKGFEELPDAHKCTFLRYRPHARCQRCGAKVDEMEGVVAKVEVRGELARLWHVECWNKDNTGGRPYINWREW